MVILIIRTIIIFAVIIICMRIMGKRQLGQLEPSELVVTVMLSEIAANPLQDIHIPLLHGIIPVLTLLCCEIFVSAAVVKSIRVRSIICGKPSIIIENGIINQTEMIRNRFTFDELVVELRKKSVTDISTVRQAILETDGSLSVLLHAGDTPATPNQLSLSVPEIDLPIILISNGRMLRNNMQLLNVNEKWLLRELSKRNISSPAEVYIFTADPEGKIYCAKKESL